MGISQRLERFDRHSSVSNEFRVRTAQGALFSMVTILSIGYLVYTELLFNFETIVEERTHVNASTPTGLQIDFDVTLPHIPCALLHIDANDPTGQPQSLHLNRKRRVTKQRISPDGTFIGRHNEHKKTDIDDLTRLAKTAGKLPDTVKAPHEIENEEKKENEPSEDSEDYCGSCYGAGSEDECCNTCDDVKRAYETKGWHLRNQKDIIQCQNEHSDKEEQGEGCRVVGNVALSTGGGNLHFTPGRDADKEIENGDITSFMQFLFSSFETFNVSHTLNRVRFGTEYPGVVHQLDGITKTIEDQHGMYQYYFQVVPTLYKKLDGTVIQTNQYSVTEHLRHVNPGSNRGLPGVFFFYEVSALHVEIEETRRGWIKFCTSVCAIVGGVVTVMGMLDQFVYNASNSDGKNGLVT
eukprot:CAMPEP_0195283716 /NCGR_PEP_ID=MMETSP0707-20130614/2170_1 /TAXON_ID=33640 /ORGANISM="Asterionellopsis glacialis, Strain CCMP134" /LENGTH=408 /DNA_ID=CAMNT_0040342935 /DNA_START=157 /DNA_END=1383 /DNA_ORIENTATION=+